MASVAAKKAKKVSETTKIIDIIVFLLEKRTEYR